MQAQILAALSILPSAILDGMFMYGLYHGGVFNTDRAAVAVCAALSVAQSAVFLFIFVEAMEARRLLRNAILYRRENKITNDSVV